MKLSLDEYPEPGTPQDDTVREGRETARRAGDVYFDRRIAKWNALVAEEPTDPRKPQE